MKVGKGPGNCFGPWAKGQHFREFKHLSTCLTKEVSVLGVWKMQKKPGFGASVKNSDYQDVITLLSVAYVI